MKSSRSSVEIDISLALGRCLAAIPDTAAAVDAFLALEHRNVFGTKRESLAGTHRDARLVLAMNAKSGIAKGYVICESRHGLHLAAHQQGVLMRDQQLPVKSDRGPATGGHQCVM